MPLTTVLIPAWLFLGTAAVAVVVLTVTGIVRRRHERQVAVVRELLVEYAGEDGDGLRRLVRSRPLVFLKGYLELIDQMRFPEEYRRRIESALLMEGIDILLIRMLNSRQVFRRCRAALYLAYVPSGPGASALDNALRRERAQQVCIRIVYAVVRRRYLQCVPSVFDSLAGASQEYRRRTTAILMGLGYDLVRLLPIMETRSEPPILQVFIQAAEYLPSPEFRPYLEQIVGKRSEKNGSRSESEQNVDRMIAREAFRVLMSHYLDQIDPAQYFFHHDRFFVNLAVEALGRTPSRSSLQMAVPYLSVEAARESAVVALTDMITAAPRLLAEAITIFRTCTDEAIRTGLAEVLAARAEYMVYRIMREAWPEREHTLQMLLSTRKATGVLALLNRSNDTVTRHEICRMIRPVVQSDPWLREEFGLYANKVVLAELDIPRRRLDSRRTARRRENPAGRPVLLIIAATVLGPMVGFGVGWWSGKIPVFLSEYLVWFEQAFVVYAVTLNSIYLIVLIAAITAVLDTHRQQALRPRELLFTGGVLPSVSIIAPAYNEESTIVESVTALLNLRYPDYEVVVVNDGSTDETLRRLIAQFELQRTGFVVHHNLNTRPVRGIYRNPRYPGLIVVDKSNGGKADSLNAGINVSRKDFFAAIDADSLLEPEALLRLAGEVLDSPVPVVAAGGNVLPVNGCRVEGGHVDLVRLSRNRAARFQTVEYIRGFMTGRTGWARLNALLIISGAFGLFDKQAVIDSRGYLTGSERLLKDTVAEDMELVVRLRRTAAEQNRRVAVRYSASATCWTEVPESVRVLAAQRNRWQRGLIDVLFYHRQTLFRPSLGALAFVGMPYHYIFELIGPWIELQGYLFLVVGLILGILPWPLALAVVLSGIGLGILVSALSLQLAEWSRKMFGWRDRLRLLGLTVLENFGYRQFVNALRIGGYISVIRQRSGWGLMRRRGFTERKKTS